MVYVELLPPMIENSLSKQIVIAFSFIIPYERMHKLLNIISFLFMAEEIFLTDKLTSYIDYSAWDAKLY